MLNAGDRLVGLINAERSFGVAGETLGEPRKTLREPDNR